MVNAALGYELELSVLSAAMESCGSSPVISIVEASPRTTSSPLSARISSIFLHR